ncbi:phytoene/squalene synthase family protein [uncultured Paludibaculum sp.]|uniref:phytoene/squalene synthase family protein n=1 Tax=uncultured Paludibaculum sp. TaxID=1765020 RepID=UPI002AABF4E9|nr:phytoene/squalene synthase family protein [uncultured Paludibaculum sp.]
MSRLADSYAHCVRVARERAKNFYYSFLVLPEEKRLAMCAIYAFMRECDDLSDEAGASLANIAGWRAEMQQTLTGPPANHPVWPAFQDTVRKYRIPARYFHEMIDGVSSDLEPRRIETFDELYRYCYLVASVVGLTTIHIFGFDDPRALALAEQCGIAFQLTNIIRDVREDAVNQRVYLPAQDLARFSVTPEALAAPVTTPEIRQLLEFEGGRAQEYYRLSRPLIAMVREDSRPALWALIEIYSQLLNRIEQRGYDVMPGKVRLSTSEKMTVLARAWLRRLF